MTQTTIMDEWLVGVQRDLEGNYIKLGLKASGKWAESLEPFKESNAGGFNLGMRGQNYTGAIENGRSPNADQSKDALKKWVGWAGNTFLKQWVIDKGLDGKISPFAVAWKIALQGWEVPNRFNAGGLVSDVVTADRVKDLNSQLSLYLVGEFKSNLISGLNVD